MHKGKVKMYSHQDDKSLVFLVCVAHLHIITDSVFVYNYFGMKDDEVVQLVRSGRGARQ